MKNSVRKITLLFFLFNILTLFNLSAVDDYNMNVLKDSIYDESIHTVQLFREGWKLSYPIIDLKGDVGLILSFDDISNEIANYHYKIVHCDFNWNPSSLSESEFISGFRQNQINDYKQSFNTYFNYVHFNLRLPNDDVRFLVSGNYAIIVFKGFDENDTAFVKRFLITEKQVSVNVNVSRPILTIYRNTGQEVNFNIIYGNLSIQDPYQDIKVAVLQNGRWNKSILNLKPLMDKTGELEYNYQSENVFPGETNSGDLILKAFDTNPLL